MTAPPGECVPHRRGVCRPRRRPSRRPRLGRRSAGVCRRPRPAGGRVAAARGPVPDPPRFLPPDRPDAALRPPRAPSAGSPSPTSRPRYGPPPRRPPPAAAPPAPAGRGPVPGRPWRTEPRRDGRMDRRLPVRPGRGGPARRPPGGRRRTPGGPTAGRACSSRPAGGRAGPALWADDPADTGLPFGWSARGRRSRRPSGSTSRFPPAPVAGLDLDLPADRTPAAVTPGVVVAGPFPGPAPDRRAWRVAFGGLARVELAVRRPGGPAPAVRAAPGGPVRPRPRGGGLRLRVRLGGGPRAGRRADVRGRAGAAGDGRDRRPAGRPGRSSGDGAEPTAVRVRFPRAGGRAA